MALARCQRAIALLQVVSDRDGEAGAWETLGDAQHHLGNEAEAFACYRRSIGMEQVLTDEPDEVREAYLQARTKEHREQLDVIVTDLLARHGLRLRFDEVVHHDDNDALRQRLASSG